MALSVNWLPGFTLLLLLGPIMAGLANTVLSAFGLLDGSESGLTLAPWRALLSTPGIGKSILFSFSTGILTTLIALGLAVLAHATLSRQKWLARVQRALPAMLAVPHAAAAFGLLFLLSPSGWLVRLISPWLSGWTQPPDLLITQDPLGLSMMLALVIKEVPFLLLVIMAAENQLDTQRRMQLAAVLGYHPGMAWTKTVFPAIYPLIRLPLFAVLCFAMSVVDVAQILGPGTPAPLAVRIILWSQDTDLAVQAMAAAAACVQLLLVVCALVLWRLAESACRWLGKQWLQAGGRGHSGKARERLVSMLLGLLLAMMLLGMLGQVVWSLAGLWQFPALLPQQYTWQNWQRQLPHVAVVNGTTVVIGIAVVVVAVTLALGCLQSAFLSRHRINERMLWVLYVPLVVPQAGFLPGLQHFFLRLGIDGSWFAVMAAHLVFVLPYVFLVLADPFRRWDSRLAQVAATLGAGQGRIFWRIRLPMLLEPVLIASAIGFAVSLGQYLPTLLLGGGRITTLTTEALALAAGGERRLIAVYVLMQLLLPLLAYGLALYLPRWFRQPVAAVGRRA